MTLFLQQLLNIIAEDVIVKQLAALGVGLELGKASKTRSGQNMLRVRVSLTCRFTAFSPLQFDPLKCFLQVYRSAFYAMLRAMLNYVPEPEGESRMPEGWEGSRVEIVEKTKVNKLLSRDGFLARKLN